MRDFVCRRLEYNNHYVCDCLPQEPLRIDRPSTIYRMPGPCFLRLLRFPLGS
jgi:hypothetical protein